MAKILLIAQGKHIARYGEELRRQLPDPGEIEIIVDYMENAVKTAKKYVGTGVEVIIARGTTADLLRDESLPISVVEIPVSDAEIIDSIKKARAMAGPDSPIGFMGFKSVIDPVRSFLDVMELSVRLYEIHSTEQTRKQIERAKKDGVEVLIGGLRSVELIKRAGLRFVLMDSSLSSVSHAYRQAKEILHALSVEKKNAEETRTIFNSVSEAIVSVNAQLRLTMSNRFASAVFGRDLAFLQGKKIDSLFTPSEQADIKQALETGEEIFGAILDRRDKKYAMRIVPIIVENATEGAVVTLQEIQALQRMEARVRKGLYQKGNAACYTFDDIEGASAGLREAVDIARNFSRLQSNVLILGETGTGKEVFAQSIHNGSMRRDRPFVAVNCGAIPAHLMESELFGYEDGAFTGAKKGGKMGLFELAHSGTLFLDEISEMDANGQVNLLRALQERQIRRIGGNTVTPVDVRVIAVCNENLYEMVRNNRFRKDLYYRLGVLVMRIPPLRDRTGDIALLARHFAGHYNRQFAKSAVLSEAALRELEAMDWDGNVRQLRNFCERMIALAEDPVISRAFVQKHCRDNFLLDGAASPFHGERKREADSGERLSGAEAVVIRGRVFTKDRLLDLVSQNNDSREALAKKLGVSRTTLWRYLKQLDVD
jgi:transcriptional regulator with PAS, ATPase and Fis domain